MNTRWNTINGPETEQEDCLEPGNFVNVWSEFDQSDRDSCDINSWSRFSMTPRDHAWSTWSA